MRKPIIVIVGVGALGSHLLLFARNCDVSFEIIDFDRTERKNILSQFHTKMGLNRNKAQALQQSMQGLFDLRIKAIPHKLTSDNVEALLGHADIVVDCLDNGASRRLVQTFVRAHERPCLHGALSADGGFGMVMWDEHFQVDDEDVPGQPTCENGEHLPFIASVASTMAFSLQKFLEDGKKVNAHCRSGNVSLL